jgi:glycosyltransferase involved in cell wall biosynthesis
LLEPEVKAIPGVHYLGFVQPEQLLELYALAKWTVVPSRREPWGVVVNEALACGCPVIVTDQVGAAADLVEDGVNGRIVPAGSPAALAAALAGPVPTGDPAKGRIEQWTHDFGVEQFLEAVQLAVSSRK